MFVFFFFKCNRHDLPIDVLGLDVVIIIEIIYKQMMQILEN